MKGLLRGDGMEGVPATEEACLDECLVCSDQKRDMLFVPCGHIAVCHACSDKVKKCLMCREFVDDRRKVSITTAHIGIGFGWFAVFQIEDCLVCSENSSSVLFKPCNHMVACENCASVMKKCVECRSPIEEAIPFAVCCGAKIANREKSKNVLEEGAGVPGEVMGGAVAGAGGAVTGPDNNMMNNGNKDTSNTDVQKLQEQLNDIKEQVPSNLTKLSLIVI